METTKLIINNYGAKAGVSSTKPSFVITPPSSTNGPASNLLINDRAVKWICPANEGLVITTVDLGAVKPVTIIGMLSIRRGTNSPSPFSWYVTGTEGPLLNVTANSNLLTRTTPGSFIIDGVKIGQPISGNRINAGTTVIGVSASTVTMSANASSNGTTDVTFGLLEWLVPSTPLNTALQSEDVAVVLNSPINVRYVTYSINSIGLTFALGKLLIGTYLDLGIAYSPGSSESLIKSGVINQTVEGYRTFTKVGPDRHAFSMLFVSVPDLIKDALFNAVKSNDVITLIHPTIGICEAHIANDSISASHKWSAPNVWDISLELETLP